jgi:hypothetical protein
MEDVKILCLQCRPSEPVPISRLETHMNEHFFRVTATRLLNMGGARMARPEPEKPA